MRAVVIGATGNVGTSVLDALAREQDVEIVAVARRRPHDLPAGVAEFVSADIRDADLAPVVRGADAVVNLAWVIPPARRERLTRSVNVEGSRRVIDAVARAGVPALLYASSVGAYSPGPKDRLVDETWPTNGISSSFYARQKAEVERMLDALEREHPRLRVVRMRPGLIFKREAASEIRRLFIGPLVPQALLSGRLLPVIPDVPRLRFQCVHSLDVGRAFARAALDDGARGAFNLAADPPLGADELADVLHARKLPVPARLLRALAAITYAARLQPSEPGWLDMALAVPLMDSARARSELGWTPSCSSQDALRDLLGGMEQGGHLSTPPLRAASAAGAVRAALAGGGDGYWTRDSA